MGFKSFALGILLRVAILVALIFLGTTIFLRDHSYLMGAVFLLAIGLQTYNLIRFGNTTNRKITKFLESIRFADFSSSFTKDSNLGPSFREMNMSFNEVIEAFRKTRAEKEEQMLFLQIMIQHINTGIISFDHSGRIGVINGTAKQLLQIPQFKDINDLGKLSKELLVKILHLRPGGSFSIKINPELHLNIQSAAFKMGGNSWTLLSFQNIKTELQKNELQAWQNLTKVLRHEIMNSMTPIASLANSLGIILEEDVSEEQGGFVIEKDSYSDLMDGLNTIEKRSAGLIHFVNAYRDYTNIPQPELKNFSVKALFDNIGVLLKEDLAHVGICLNCEIQPQDLQLTADPELIQMILINLIKNAKEALGKSEHKEIIVRAGLTSHSYPFIQVIDYGEGIVPEAVERIFVPFYTTKKTGSGIGLSISRQIMNLHKGSLQVQSVPNEKTIFTLNFG
ncbi:histidine kinase [Litoribacter ruber]|uniref:sensor histidine kinase n=1 Tax=Litoribacter ruber TaxID=702568 RepID=UPI001BDA4B49|nr:ATP-binding protein [Litoribacter ruber]MBT0811278.1 histidine kinase [Litoribacter ruber]